MKYLQIFNVCWNQLTQQLILPSSELHVGWGHIERLKLIMVLSIHTTEPCKQHIRLCDLPNLLEELAHQHSAV